MSAGLKAAIYRRKTQYISQCLNANIEDKHTTYTKTIKKITHTTVTNIDFLKYFLNMMIYNFNCISCSARHSFNG